MYWLKFIGKGSFFFFWSAYVTLLIVLRDIKYYDSYGIYLAAQQGNKLTRFPVSANIATGLREAHTNLMFSLAILVLEYSTGRNNAMSYVSLHRVLSD